MKRTLRFLTNKFIITAIVFLLLMIFFDQNNWFIQKEREKDLEATQEKIDHLDGEVVRMEKELSDLNNDNAKLEQLAREKYHEKRDGEDVYIIIPDTVKPRKNN